MLKDPEKNQKLNDLIAKVSEERKNVISIEQKLDELSENIKRNKNLILALEQENKELAESSNAAVVSESGEVDFSKFEDKSEKIRFNNEKIKKLEEIIPDLEHKLDYMIYSEYTGPARKHVSNNKGVYGFYAKNLLNEFFNDPEIKRKLAEIYTAFRLSGDPIYSNNGFYPVNECFSNDFLYSLVDCFKSQSVSLDLPKFEHYTIKYESKNRYGWGYPKYPKK